MENTYIEHEFMIQRNNADGSVSFIPKDEANADYQAYLESLKETKK